MVDIRREARRYADSHPYEIVPIRQRYRQENFMRFRLRITQQPEPNVAIILGDFVHNLRSALDHIVVASSSPRSARKNAGFPIATENLWARDGKRRYIVRDAERRKSFVRAIDGLSPLAQATVKACQAYHMPDRAATYVLTLLSRLENADKHRELITIASGIERPVLALISGDAVGIVPVNLGPKKFLKDGAEIHLPQSLSLEYPEMQVKCRGAAAISVQVADGERNSPSRDYNLYRLMRKALSTVRFILRKMEPFVIR